MKLCRVIYCNVTLELTRLGAQEPARLAWKNSTCQLQEARMQGISPDASSLSLRTILLSSDRCTLLTSLKHVNYSTD